MNHITVTLTFTSIAVAIEALSRLSTDGVIAHIDRPDVGISLTPLVGSNPFAVIPDPSIKGRENLALPGSTLTPPAPPAPAAASLPASAPAATAVVPPAGVELDTAGIPWDGRIHGSEKTKNKDGTWRQKRGLNDAALKSRVEAELRAGQAARAPVAPAAPVTVPVPPATDAQSAAASPAPGSAPTDGVPAAPAVPVAPAAPVTAETFGGLMARIAPLTMTNPAAAAKVNEALAAFQLTALAQLAARPDLIAAFSQTVDAMLATLTA